MKKKNILMLFSGGLDSTYLMYKNLEEGHIVHPIYVDLENNASIQRSEFKAASAIHQKMREEFGSDKLYPFQKPLSLNIRGQHSFDLPQIPIWIFSTFCTNLMKVDEVQIAYVMKDDAISYLDEIKEVFDLYVRNFARKSINTKLTFPLSKLAKHEIANDLPNRYFQMTAFCEWPSVDDDDNITSDCGECSSCKSAQYSGIFYKYVRNRTKSDSPLAEEFKYQVDPNQLSLFDENAIAEEQIEFLEKKLDVLEEGEPFKN